MRFFQRTFTGERMLEKDAVLRTFRAMLFVALVANPGLARAGADKIDICHYDKTLDTWTLSSVGTNGKALEKHLAHGDVFPGDDVPELPGYYWDENCVQQAITPIGVDLLTPYAYKPEYSFLAGTPPFEITIIVGPFAFSGEMMLAAAGVPGEELDFAVATPPSNGSVIIKHATKVCDQVGCTVLAVYEPDCSGWSFPGCDMGTYVPNFGWHIEQDDFTYVASGLGGESAEAMVTMNPAALPPLLLPEIPENNLWYAVPTVDTNGSAVFQNITIESAALSDPSSEAVQDLLQTSQIAFTFQFDSGAELSAIQQGLTEALIVDGCGGDITCGSDLSFAPVFEINCQTAWYDGRGYDDNGLADLATTLSILQKMSTFDFFPCDPESH